MECIVLDHSAFCRSECHFKKFHAGKQRKNALLLHYCRSQKLHSLKNNLQPFSDVDSFRIQPPLLLTLHRKSGSEHANVYSCHDFGKQRFRSYAFHGFCHCLQSRKQFYTHVNSEFSDPAPIASGHHSLLQKRNGRTGMVSESESGCYSCGIYCDDRRFSICVIPLSLERIRKS